MLTTKGEIPEHELEKREIQHERDSTFDGRPAPSISLWTEYYKDGELVRRDISSRPMTHEEQIAFFKSKQKGQPQ